MRERLGPGAVAPLFLALAMGANGLQYIYQVAMARLLDPAQYAVLLALVSFVGILLFPGNAFQSAVAVGTGQLAEGGSQRAIWPFTRRAIFAGPGVALAASLALATVASPLSALFGSDSGWVLFWMLLILPLSLVLATARGALQGLARFLWLGSALLCDAVVRVALAITLVSVGFGLAGAVASFSVGIVVAVGVALWSLRPRVQPVGHDEAAGIWQLLRTQLRTVPATFAIFGVQSIDVVIANWRLGDAQLEPFSAAVLAGRVSFYGCFMLGQLLLPRLRAMFAAGELDRRLLYRGSLAVLGIALGPLALGLAFPQLVHLALVGPAYGSDAGLLQVYLAGAALLSLTLYLVYMLIAAGVTWIWRVLAPVALVQTGAYLWLAGSVYDFAGILLAAAAAMFIASAIAGGRLLTGRRRALMAQ